MESKVPAVEPDVEEQGDPRLRGNKVAVSTVNQPRVTGIRVAIAISRSHLRNH